MVTRAVPLKTNLLYVLNVFTLSFNSKLQSVVLQQQSFLQKCETWMEFLTQTEQNLTAEISGNYQSLLEQQRDHEVNTNIHILVSFSSCYVVKLCLFTAIPGRDVQQAANSLFHHQ